ncbi:Maf family protein [Shewanella psychrotolerans]|uniref:Maf family protein n=1 Tax=Shewanella psychrotolerans TaxID=2864206 RepID=UPI001C656306|nr:Maf family protein [Shewanella psychrotolerans]QYK00130.1 Maf family nucleotide pyrophosphatase [Shewanella psychrotolerans]
MSQAIILASTSSYRKLLLEKLGITFETCSIDTNETPQPNETAPALVTRLAIAKAIAGAKDREKGIVIGSDQVAVIDGEIIGKPLNAENAVKQLMRSSGKAITFYTGLALYNIENESIDAQHETFTVHFRSLTESQIRYYVDKEQPFYCAGSFKSEGLGIALFDKLEGRDPNTLIGLPLILLIDMLAKQNIDVLSQSR